MKLDGIPNYNFKSDKLIKRVFHNNKATQSAAVITGLKKQKKTKQKKKTEKICFEENKCRMRKILHWLKIFRIV